MASRRASPENDPPAEVLRRAPFSDNPEVGARGQRTQQRILDAALEVFGEQGYHQCSIDPIAKRAGCSRASFYQYFSGKEDVFHHLSGQVARQLNASTEALGPVTADEAGWVALRAWVGRRSEIYQRYEPVFHAFPAAAESDQVVAAGSAQWSARTVAMVRSKVATTDLRPRQVDPVIMQVGEAITRTLDMARILRSAVEGHYDEARVGDALTDVMHRSLFGLDAEVNVHPAAVRTPPTLRFDFVIRDVLERGGPPSELTTAGHQTLTTLMEAGRKVFVERGYHRTRVDDVVEAAGVSHGAFYRYFDNKDQLARILTTSAMRTVSRVLAEIPPAPLGPDAAGRAALRRWLRRYGVTQADEAAMIRVWADAALSDATVRANSAPALDWGRRAMAGWLEPRGFGDIDTEALVMVALLSSFGARERSTDEVDAVTHIIEQGLLGTSSR
ncbi:MAG TPA: TetR/AcrR family transcriptional regulator [Microthrixaceae bacterium]|nr:TetR/AcrR family transcriptional regulator [Microthrixaceae bacterium]